MATSLDLTPVPIPENHPFKQGVCVVMAIYCALPENNYRMTTKWVAIFVAAVKDGIVTYLDGVRPKPHKRPLSDFYTNAPKGDRGQPMLPRILCYGNDADGSMECTLLDGLRTQRAAQMADMRYPHWLR